MGGRRSGVRVISGADWSTNRGVSIAAEIVMGSEANGNPQVVAQWQPTLQQLSLCLGSPVDDAGADAV